MCLLDSSKPCHTLHATSYKLLRLLTKQEKSIAMRVGMHLRDMQLRHAKGQGNTAGFPSVIGPLALVLALVIFVSREPQEQHFATYKNSLLCRFFGAYVPRATSCMCRRDATDTYIQIYMQVSIYLRFSGHQCTKYDSPSGAASVARGTAPRSSASSASGHEQHAPCSNI